MTLPAWMRQVQQSVYFHLVQSAALAAGAAYFTCDPAKQTQGCLEVGAAAFFGALYLTFQHSPGSASFKADGTVNKTVENAVVIQKAVEADPTPITQRAVQNVAQAAAQSAGIVADALKFEAKP